MTHGRYRITRPAYDTVQVFGLLGAHELPGPIIIEVMRRLSYSESSTRNQLAKLTRRGVLTVRKVGRYSVYGISDVIREQFEKIAEIAPSRPFKGKFYAVIYSIPEAYREIRDRFIYYSAYFEYGQLRPGILINLADRSGELFGKMSPPSPECFTTTGVLVPPSLETARIWAERAFHTNRTRAMLGTLDQQLSGLERNHGGGAPLLTHLTDVLFSLGELSLRLPNIPSSLSRGDDARERVRLLRHRAHRLLLASHQPGLVALAHRHPLRHLVAPDASVRSQWLQIQPDASSL